MKTSNTTIARSMGYLSSPSVEDKVYHQNNIVVMGPSRTDVRSYHQGGMSSKDIWKAQRRALVDAGLSFR